MSSVDTMEKFLLSSIRDGTGTSMSADVSHAPDDCTACKIQQERRGEGLISDNHLCTCDTLCTYP